MKKMVKPAPKKMAPMSLDDLNKPELKVVELVNNKDGCYEKYNDGRVVGITDEQWRERLSQILGKDHVQSQSAK